MKQNQDYKVVTKGWYGRITGILTGTPVVQHFFGDVIEIEPGILIFIFKKKQGNWGLVHFETGRGLCYLPHFPTRKGAIQRAKEILSEDVFLKNNVITIREALTTKFEDLKEAVEDRREPGEPGWRVNYLNPKRESRR